MKRLPKENGNEYRLSWKSADKYKIPKALCYGDKETAQKALSIAKTHKNKADVCLKKAVHCEDSAEVISRQESLGLVWDKWEGRYVFYSRRKSIDEVDAKYFHINCISLWKLNEKVESDGSVCDLCSARPDFLYVYVNNEPGYKGNLEDEIFVCGKECLKLYIMDAVDSNVYDKSKKRNK